MNAVEFEKLHYGPLIPVIPPGAILSSRTKVKPEGRGKTPGRPVADGWIGIPWSLFAFRGEEIDKMRGPDGLRPNIGLICGDIVALDFDVRDEALCVMLTGIARSYLNAPPAVRIGQAPKRVLLCRRRGPVLAKQQLHITTPEGREFLVELLAKGQQVVLWGEHPSGVAYRYPEGIPDADLLPEVDGELIEVMFTEMQEVLEGLGMTCSRTRSTAKERKTNVPQEELQGSLERLWEAIRAIPNDSPDRKTYIDMGIAIKAATTHAPEEGLAMYIEWGLQWPGNTVDSITRDFESFRPPFEIGSRMIYDMARGHGVTGVEYDFPVAVAVADEPPPQAALPPPAKPAHEGPVLHSDVWLANRMIAENSPNLRYARHDQSWYYCENGFWVPDSLRAHECAIDVCVEAADHISREGVTPTQIEKSVARARALCSARTVGAVEALAAKHKTVQVDADDFDANPDFLGVPGGVVDLRSGLTLPMDREWYISKRTAVSPIDTPPPLWGRFLWDAMGGNPDMIAYLQRMAGYCLTGHTREHAFFVLQGSGGNGKGVFLNALSAIMGRYCQIAQIETFMASDRGGNTSVLIAALAGARVVQAQETKAGQKWEDSLLKQLTGGDPVTARNLYSAPFTFVPRFKIAVGCNHQPRLASVGPAMRRRMHLVPFKFRPPVVNLYLPEQLKSEYAAILGWAIEGARQWYTQGLNPPPEVVTATNEYMENEDVVGRWIADCCEERSGERGDGSTVLYESWCAWCRSQGVMSGSQVSFTKRLKERGYASSRQAAGIVWDTLLLKKQPTKDGENSLI